jgi:Tfp pilus assembly protein PilV
MQTTMRKRTHRRGVTMPEVLISALILGVFGLALVGFSRVSAMAWTSGLGDQGSQKSAQAAMQEIAKQCRAARQVAMDSSNATRLTLQLPSYDGSGNLVIPQTNGSVISYYVADVNGTYSANGTCLWRSVNGEADRNWSMRGSTPRFGLAPGGFSVTYVPSADPESVIVTLTTQVSSTGLYAASSVRKFATSQELMLRNKGL